MKVLFRFWNELKRRNVVKGLISYIVFSWVLLQVISVLGSLVQIPQWIGKTGLIILLILLPFWLIFSWFYDITSNGISRAAPPDGKIDETRNVAMDKRLNVFILVTLSIAVLLLFVDRMRLLSEKELVNRSTNLLAYNSIAVLPFNDISSLRDQAYFADGLAEELINTLSKITNIKVTSRTSAFSFKGKTIDIPTIAKQLDVNYILEGSIRTFDSIVRVSVQLVDAKNDTYTWSQTWDKKLENIFQIQNEISQKVAEKLEISLLDIDFPAVQEVDPEAYRLYLMARYEINSSENEDSDILAKELLIKSLAIDSTYAPTWELLSRVYHYLDNSSATAFGESYTLAKNAGLRALKEDSTLASTYDILGTIAIDYERDYLKAQELVKKGLSIEPHNPDVLNRASEVALIFGDFEQALKYNLKVVELNPLDGTAYWNLGLAYYFSKKYKESEKAFKKSLQLEPNTNGTYSILSTSLMLQGKLEEALETAIKEVSEPYRLYSLAMVYNAQGNIEKADSYLKELIAKYEETYSYQIATAYASFKDTEKAFYWLEKALVYKDFGLMESNLEPNFSYLKEDPRWSKFLDRLGFLPK